MNLLAFTTSTDRGSIAVVKKDRIVATKQWTRSAQHSEVLTPSIKQLLTRAKMKPADLDAVAVDRGPGSFTGCRMAVNVARTIAFSLDIPLFSQTSLAIMAFASASEHDGIIHCLLNAHKSLLYSQVFQCKDGSLQPLTKAEALPLEKILATLDSGVLVVGDIPSDMLAAIKARGPLLAKKTMNEPQAKALALMALAPEFNEFFSSWTTVEPSYVRVPDVLANVQSPSSQT
jgi:tRNA threonylcarbamoyladenosine biosynthesis protein TsaB